MRPRVPGIGAFSMMSLTASLYFPILIELDIPLDIDVGRTGQGARGPVQLGNGKTRRDRLGIGAINGLASAQVHVEFIFDGYRADLDALAATRAFLQVD